MAAGNGQKKPGTALAVMAQRVMVPEEELKQTLMQTAFKGASPAEFTVLVMVANKYNLDPFMREIYAFPKQGGGIVPLVPIDGWLKLIRTNADFAGMDVEWSDEMTQPSPKAKKCPEWVQVTIHHKSHPEHPTVHREYIDEMYRDTGPWNTTTKRQLEWKGVNQTGRIAFGLSGIYDQDEAERISEGEIIEGTATEEQAPVGEEGWAVIVAAASKAGYSEDDALATAATFGWEGAAGADMPRDVAERVYRAIPKEAAPATQDAATAPETVDADEEPQRALTRQQKRDHRADQAAAERALFPDDDPTRPAGNAEKAELADLRAALTDEQDRELMDGVDLTGATSGEVAELIARAREAAS